MSISRIAACQVKEVRAILQVPQSPEENRIADLIVTRFTRHFSENSKSDLLRIRNGYMDFTSSRMCENNERGLLL